MKVNLNELRAEIRSIIKEATEEEPKKFREKEKLDDEQLKELAEWVKRQWYSLKYKNKPWYRTDVTVEDIIKYMTDEKAVREKFKGFPITPTQLTTLFQAKERLGSIDIDRVERRIRGEEEIEGTEETAEAPLEKGKLDLGKYAHANTEDQEATLRQIGNALGVSVEMARLYVDTAKKAFEDRFDTEDHVLVDPEKFETYFEEAVEKYVALLKASEYDVDAFIEALKEANVLTPRDETEIKPAELTAIAILMDILEEEQDEEKVIRLIKKDFGRDSNVLSTFQNALAKIYKKGSLNISVPPKQEKQPEPRKHEKIASTVAEPKPEAPVATPPAAPVKKLSPEEEEKKAKHKASFVLKMNTDKKAWNEIKNDFVALAKNDPDAEDLREFYPNWTDKDFRDVYKRITGKELV